MTAMRVGFAARDITPPLGLPLGGYGARIGGADAVLDPLYCRAAVFDAGDGAFAIVVLDLVHVFGDWVESIRKRAAAVGIASDRLLIAATHTHAGPGVFRSSIEHHAGIGQYEQQLQEIVLDCVDEARREAGEAELRYGTAPVAGVAANRRDPSLPIDATVRVISAHDAAGHVRGVIANFGCHPTVLSAANHAYSGDLFGAAARQAAEKLGVPVLCINAAAGDVSTRFTRRDQTYGEVLCQGGTIAAAIEAAVAVAMASGDASLGAATLSVAVQWREVGPPDAILATLQAALSGLDQMRERGADPATVRVAQARVEGAQAELWVASHGGWSALFGPRAAVAELQALRCGDVTVVAVPGELFAQAGMAVQRSLGDRALIAGYANDYLGYLIPERDAAAGGYEALIAMVDPRCEAAIRRGLVTVAQMAGQGG